MADIFEITGRIHSTSQEHVATVADEILDETKGKKQSQVNAETDATLAEHTSTINGLNSQNYVTVTATDQTTAVTDVLPATGEVATVYRVGNWDGSQYDVTCYSEYSWNGTQYKHLSTKTQIGEVFDISAYHATGGVLAEYANLAAALDSNNGGGVPQSLQKGGMSIKFVRTSDNKYVQARCISDEFTTDVTKWQCADKDLVAGSINLTESGGAHKRYMENKVAIGGLIDLNTLDWVHKYINTSSSGNHPVNSTGVAKDLLSYTGIKVPIGARIDVTVGSSYGMNLWSFNEGYPEGEAPTQGLHFINTTGSSVKKTIFVTKSILNISISKWSGNTEVTIEKSDLSAFSLYISGISDNPQLKDGSIPVHVEDRTTVNVGEYYTTNKRQILFKVSDSEGKEVLPSPDVEGAAFNVPIKSLFNVDGKICNYIDGALVELINEQTFNTYKDNCNFPITWQQGTNGTTPGTISLSTIRCIAFAKAATPCYFVYKLSAGYSVIVKEWNDGDSDFYGPKSWFGGIGIYNTAKTNYSLTIKKDNGGNISPSDLTPDIVQILITDEYNIALNYLDVALKDISTQIDNYVQGTVQTNGENIGQIVASNIRCIAVLDIPINTGISVVCADRYKVSLAAYSDGDTSTISTGFREECTTFRTWAQHSYLIVGKVNNASINPSEAIANVKACYTKVLNQSLLSINTLENEVFDRQRNGIEYIGEALPFGRKMLIKDYMVIPNWSDSQGGAIYGDYLVTCMATDEIADNTTNGFVYNIKTGVLVSELIFGYTLNGVDYQKPHANEVCFGNEFYNDDSQFPLLYVSQVRDSGASVGVKGGVMVYDLQYDSVNLKYVPVLVQVIMPDTEDADLMDVWGKYTPNYIVDTDNGFLYVLNYPQSSWYNLTGNTYVCKFALPKLQDGGVITLTSADLIEHYEIPNCYGLQMTFYYGGKLFISGGFNGINANKSIRVWDLTKKCQTTFIDLTGILAEEPQFIGLYKNRFLWYGNGTSGLISEFIF